MGKTNTTVLNFVGGEIAPIMDGRSDLKTFAESLSWCQNFIIQPQGGADYRQGSLFSAITAGNQLARLIPFQFSTDDAIMIVATNEKFTFFRNNEAILNTSSISIVSFEGGQAAPTDPVEISTFPVVHGLNPGDIIYITGCQGQSATNVGLPGVAAFNGRFFVVVSAGSYTFTIHDELGRILPLLPSVAGWVDSGSGYTGNGVFSQVYQLTTPFVTDDLLELRTAQVGDIMFIVHQNYTPQQLTRSGFTSWTIANIAFTDSPFSDGNNPAVVGFSADVRLCLANSQNSPQGFWSSALGSGTSSNFTDFNVGSGLASDAIAFLFSPVNGQIDGITALQEFNSMMAILGSSSIQQVYGSTQQLPANPTAVNTDVTIQGAANMQPIVLNWDLIFVDVNRKQLRGMQYNLAFNDFASVDYTLTSRHLGEESPFIKILPTKGLPYLIWVLRADGALLCLTFDNIQNISGFSRFYLGGNGSVIDIGTIRNANGSDQLWMIVEREIDGITAFSVEVVSDRPVFSQKRDFYTGPANQASDYANYLNDIWETQKNYCYLDGAQEYDGRARGIAAAATITMSALTGSVTITSNQNVFLATDVGAQIWVNATLGGGRAQITAYTDATHVTATVVENYPAGATSGITPGLWEIAVNTISNLGLYEGQTLNVQIDGGPHPDVTVVNSTVNFTWYGARIFTGFNYIGLMATQNLGGATPMGSSAMYPRNIKRCRARLLNSIGGKLGPDEYTLYDMITRRAVQNAERVSPPFTGVYDMPFLGTWSNSMQQAVVFHQDCVPLTVLALDVELDTNAPL